MWVESLNIANIKSFSSEQIAFSKSINILIGANNSGKSTILQAILRLQYSHIWPSDDPIRKNTTQGHIIIALRDINRDIINEYEDYYSNKANLDFNINNKNTQSWVMAATNGSTVLRFPTIKFEEPNNLIYPFLSKRKVGEFSELINESTVLSVNQNMANLSAIVDNIGNPVNPNYAEFSQECEDILGFQISSVFGKNGKVVGSSIEHLSNIHIDQMGEGIAHIVWLIARLCSVKNRVFIIEEIENDIHPQALKKLLQLILRKSEHNQFIISTHSNIVAKYLGGAPESKIFNCKIEYPNKIPSSTTEELSTSEQRRRALLDLGYEFSDYDLWAAWLILEESSAERIIREYLFKWFTPSLQNKVRTISASSISRVEAQFDDFNRLFIFTHLSQLYLNRAWVLVDGGKVGDEVISALKENYKASWRESQFRALQQTDFEYYYPVQFKDEAVEVLQIRDKKAKWAKKKLLLDRVIEWIEQDQDVAKAQFESSAAEVIDFIREIEDQLNSAT